MAKLAIYKPSMIWKDNNITKKTKKYLMNTLVLSITNQAQNRRLLMHLAAGK